MTRRLTSLAALVSAVLFPACGTPPVIDIDTASLGTGSAFLNLYFLGLSGVTAANATVSHLGGALDGAAQLSAT